MNLRKLALLSVIVPLCIGIQLTPRPPNVEFTSFLTFVIGWFAGGIVGLLVGCLVMFINGFYSPWGFGGLNIPFQMLGMAIIGLVGGLYRKFWEVEKISLNEFFFEAAVIGALLTLIYDFITNFGVAVSYTIAGTPFHLALISALISGVPFSLIHIASNIFVFGILFVPVSNSILRFMEAKYWLKKEL